MNKTTKAEMKAFEELMSQPKCSHGTVIGHDCNACDREVMEDFVLHNYESMDESEIAQAIKEGVVTLRQVQTQMRVNAVWQDE